MTELSLKLVASLVFTTFLLSACGGGSGGGNSSTAASGNAGTTTGITTMTSSANGLKGIAANGAPLANVTVTALTAPVNGTTVGTPTSCSSATTDSAGNFNIDLSGCVAISNGLVVLSSTDPNTGVVLFTAYAPASGLNYVNLTPLTTLMLASAGANTPQAAVSMLDNSFASNAALYGIAGAQNTAFATLAGEEPIAKMTLCVAASSIMSWNAWMNTDFFSTQFSADHTGIDAILDSVTLNQSAAGYTLSDNAGNVLLTPDGNSLSSPRLAQSNFSGAASTVLYQATSNPAVVLVPPPRNYSGITTSGASAGSCSLTVSMSNTSAPGTVSGACNNPLIGNVTINGSVSPSGQANLTNNAGVTFTGGITGEGGAGTWTNGKVSGTWSIY